MSGVEILTDDYGVGHVYADDRYHLAYGQGYAQATDRLFELDVLRHVGYGESAGVIGPSQLASDVQVRRDLYSRAELERQLEAAPTSMQETLRGFADGVNRGLVELLRERDPPAEFAALGHAPELWEPVDSVAIAAYLIGYFGVFGGHELENAVRFARLCESVGEREAWRAYGDLNWRRVPEGHYTTIAPGELTVDGGEDDRPYEEVPEEQVDLAKAAAGARPWGLSGKAARYAGFPALREARGITSGFEWGSNALAVSGEHTETGAPMLFGGPQMGYFRPPMVHEVGLHGAGYDCAGVGVVGMPGIVIGRTPEFAWSVTSGYDDMVDTVAVRLHPRDDHRYGWHGEYREMETETVTHRPSIWGALANGEFPRRSVEQDLAWIDEGERMPVVAWNPVERIAWAQRTTTRGEELDAMSRWFSLARADSLDGAEDALSEFPFSFNFVMANDEEIRYVHAGTVPERDPEFDGRLPAPAEEYHWSGVHIGAGLGMRVADPDRGYLVQWNNAPAAGWRAGDAEGRWGPVHRADLLDRLVRERIDEGPLSLSDVEGILRDAATHDPVAPHTAPFMIEAGRGSDDPLLREMADRLSEWADAGYPWRAREDDRYEFAGMRIWEVVREELQAVFSDDLGGLAPDLRFEPPRGVDPGENEDPHAADHGRLVRDVALVMALRGETAHDWLGGERDAVIRDAMARAADRLTEEFGTDRTSLWRAPVRTSKFESLGALPEVEIPMVNRGTWNQVVSLGDGRAKGVLPPSNSGHLPLSALPNAIRGTVGRELNDQLSMYEEFRYKPLPVERERVERRAVERETLSPESLGRFPRLRALLGR